MDAESLRLELERLKAGLPHSAAAGSGAEVPEWLGAGVEGLPEFFEATAPLWDRLYPEPLDSPFLTAFAKPIGRTFDKVRVMDLGCGTGMEFPPIFARAPHAQLTAVDIAPSMLEQVRRKFPEWMKQIELVEASCLKLPGWLSDFDYIVSRLTMNHFPPAVKGEVYKEIRQRLKPGGCYIEGDHSVSAEREGDILKWYEQYIAKLPGGERGRWNFSVTLSVQTQCELLSDAGFNEIELTCESRGEDGNGWVVLTAR